jgi:hypothetical protein
MLMLLSFAAVVSGQETGEQGSLIKLADTIAVPDSLQDEVLYLKGKAHQSVFQYGKALECYTLASRYDSTIVSYRVNRGMILSRLGRTEIESTGTPRKKKKY